MAKKFKEQIVALRLSEPGLTYKEIAARLGCSDRRVIDVCNDTGLKRDRREFKEAVIALRNSEPDLPYAAIAARLNCSYHTVTSVCSKADLKCGRNSSLREVLKLGHAALRAGVTVQQIEGMAHARHA